MNKKLRRYEEINETINKQTNKIVRVFRGSQPDPRVDPRGVQNVTGRVGSGQEVFKPHVSGQVGSRGDEKPTGRVGSGRVSSHLAGNRSLAGRASMTRGWFLLTRGSGPGIRLANPTLLKNTFRSLNPTASLVPILNNTPMVS